MQNKIINFKETLSFIRTSYCPVICPRHFSVMQRYQWDLSWKTMNITKLQCRQTGKSMVTINEFIRDSCYLLPGDTIVICIKQNKKIEEKVKNDLLLELFKGYSNHKEINQLGISLNSELKDIMIKNFDIDKSLWTSLKSKNFIDSKLENCKLFLKDFEQDANQNWSGVLFNGVKLLVIAETSNVSGAIRGSKIAMSYLEEVGEYRSDIYTDIIEPSAIRQSTFDEGVHNRKVRGKHYSVLTLNQQDGKNHWSYRKYISNQIDNDQVDKSHRFGLDIYHSKENNSVVQLGDIENMWQYIPNGKEYFEKLQSSRPFKSKIEFLYDIDGNLIPDETSAVKDKDGNIRYIGYKYNILRTKTRGSGLDESEDAYQRECRMVAIIDAKTFKISNNNIIERNKFNENLYDKINGYDDGTEDKRFEIELKLEDRSASSVVNIAIKRYANETQYIIYNAYYIKNPTYKNIFTELEQSVKNKTPIICESVMFAGKDKNNFGKKESKYDRLLASVGKNKYHLGYNIDSMNSTYIIKCAKNNIDDRIKQFNDMLTKTRTESGLIFKHPFDDEQQGYQIMITDNCKPLIDYLNYQSYSKKDGKLLKCRDDIWDACWYAISYYENNKNYMDKRFYMKKNITSDKNKYIDLTPHQRILLSYQR